MYAIVGIFLILHAAIVPIAIETLSGSRNTISFFEQFYGFKYQKKAERYEYALFNKRKCNFLE